MSWRLMTPADLPRVQILADTIHIDHPEDPEVLAERRRLYPQGCFVLDEGEDLTGYALTHPWRFGEPPALNVLLGELPRHATTYYIHDVALLRPARGKGHAARAVGLIKDRARQAGFGNLSLVAVNKSQAIWERLGFRTRVQSSLESKLLSYGPDAVLMVRDLAQSQD